MPGSTLSPRQLNRTVLARQLLLTRVDLDIPPALQQVGGLQTQYAPSGYVELWSVTAVDVVMDRIKEVVLGILTLAPE